MYSMKMLSSAARKAMFSSRRSAHPTVMMAAAAWSPILAHCSLSIR